MNQRFPDASGERWTLDGTAYMRRAATTGPMRTTTIVMRHDREAIAGSGSMSRAPL